MFQMLLKTNKNAAKFLSHCARFFSSNTEEFCIFTLAVTSMNLFNKVSRQLKTNLWIIDPQMAEIPVDSPVAFISRL